jgi:hypothetical protein
VQNFSAKENKISETQEIGFASHTKGNHIKGKIALVFN